MVTVWGQYRWLYNTLLGLRVWNTPQGCAASVRAHETGLPNAYNSTENLCNEESLHTLCCEEDGRPCGNKDEARDNGIATSFLSASFSAQACHIVWHSGYSLTKPLGNPPIEEQADELPYIGALLPALAVEAGVS